MESEHLEQLLGRLVTYVPFFWVRKVFELPRPPQPSSEWRHGAVLTVELSGLGPLSEHAGRLGADGADELGRLLNLALASLLEQAVFPAGGNLVRVGGEELIAFFLGERALERAAACALRMHVLLDRTGPRLGGDSALRLRAAVSRGPIYLAQIGDPAERMEVVVAGPALAEALSALEETRAGEVLVPTARVEKGVNLEVGAARGLLAPVLSVEPEPDPQPLVELGPHFQGQTLTKINALRPFLPPDLFDRLLVDPSASAPPPRFVRASVLLAEFWSIDPASPVARDEFNRRFLLAHRIVQRHGGVLSRLDFTGRGRRVEALFGAPEPKGSHEERALNCALDLRAALGPARMRAAVNTGFLFCGEVGSALKREQVALGEAVQVCARLLQSADEGAILAGPEALRGGGGSFELGPSWSVRLKGVRNPVSARAVLRRHDRVRAAVSPGRLAGRSRELGKALAEVERLWIQGGSLVVVGKEGMGKTRFLRELVAQATGRSRFQAKRLRCSYLTREHEYGLVLACAQALSGERRPIAEWLEALPELCESQVKALGEFDPQAGPEGHRALIRRLAADLLAHLASRPRTLLVVDDLHMADAESLAVLRDLASRQALPLLASSAESLGQGFGELALPPLDQGALAELTREQLGEAPPSLVGWLESRSEGNALTARSLLAWLLETDALEKTPQGMALRSAGLEAVPPVLAAALPTMPSPYPLPVSESGPHAMPEHTDPGQGGPPEAPDELARRQEAHRKLAEMIEAVPGASGERMEELALLYGESDRPEKAVQYARAASGQAAHRARFGLALRWAEAAARAAQLVDDERLRREVRLEEALGWHRLFDPQRAYAIAREVWQAAASASDAPMAMRASVVAAVALADGCAPEAEGVCRTALAMAEAAQSPADRARCLIALSRALRARGELSEAEFVLERGTELAGTDEELRLLALVQSGLLRAERGERDRARAALEAAAVLSVGTQLARHRPLVLINLGVVRGLFGDLPGAEQACREAEVLAGELGLVIPRAAALVNLSDLHREAGDLEQARQLADAARLEAARAGDARVAAAALVARAQCCAPGEDALALAQEAVGQLERIDDASTFIESMGQLARLATERGERGWARELFTAARARAEATGIERHRKLLDRLDEVLRAGQPAPRPVDPSIEVTAPGS